MINTEKASVRTTTLSSASAVYPIPFEYDWTSSHEQPELVVYVDGWLKTYGTDYTVDTLGLQFLVSPGAGKTLEIRRKMKFTQETDYQTGLIDPEQIENSFDRSVMRDQELRNDVSAVRSDLTAETEERTTADTLLQDAIDDEAEARSLADTTLQDNIDAEADAREDADDALQAAINTKQDIIADLATIRSGAAAGATAVQPGDLATVATTGSYDDLSNKPKYATSINLSIDQSTFVVTAQLKDQDGQNIGSAQTIDLPLESVVVSGAYDSATKEVVLTLEGGSTIRFSVADLVSGLQTEITISNKLDATLVDDTNSTNKFVTNAEKATWSGKQDAISDLATIRSGAAAGATAVQPGDNISDLVNDSGFITASDLPSAETGTVGQVYTKTATGAEWADATGGSTVTFRVWGANE